METNDFCENADYNFFNIWMDSTILQNKMK